MANKEKLTRKEQANQTRERLFNAAYSLLSESEFEKITVQDIVKRAGVSIGTFYLYYPSKLDVFYQTYSIADAYFIEHVAPLLETGSTFEKLLLFFNQYAVYNTEFTSLKLTKLLYNSDNKCFLRNDNSGMLSLLSDIIIVGHASGELDQSMTTDEIFHFLMNAVRGLIYNWCISNGSYDLCTSMHAFVKRLYRAVCS